MEKYDLLAIGDIVTDAFIKLKEASIAGTPDKPDYKLCLSFAEKIPYEEVYVVPAVGNSPNAAVAVAKLGLKAALLTNLGSDDEGKKCLEALRVAGVNTDLVRVHDGAKTNYHYVLWYERDRTILVKHEHYEYRLPDLGEPEWIYLSSLGENTLPYHQEIMAYLEAHKEVKLAFQPGTYQMKFGKEVLRGIYERTKVFFSNVEEAERILGIDTLGIKELLTRMHELGPETVVITDGPKGAYAYDGTNYLFQPPFPDPEGAFERTGAGDAFASTVVGALILGKELKIALAWASANSKSVVHQIGAQAGLLNVSEIEKLVSEKSSELEIKSL